MSKKTNKDSMSFRRSLRSGSYTAVVSAALVVILVFVNLIMTVLPGNAVLFDLTENGMYSLGDTTGNVLDTVEIPVTIYHIYEEGQEAADISTFIRRYSDSCSDVKIEAVDPGLNPNFVSQYTDEQIENNSLIVVSEKRSTVVHASDMYKYYMEGQYLSYAEYNELAYMYYMYYGTAPAAEEYFFAEQAVTSAIDYVITENIPVMYYTSKHGETEINATYTEIIGNENIELKQLDLLTSNVIPDDAEAIIINAPTIDFSKDETDLLMKYMTGGGDVVLLTNYATEMNTKLPNLTAFCKAMGLTSVDGMLMEEATGSYYQSPYITLPTINETSAPAALMKSTNVPVLMPVAHGIKIDESSPYTVTSILKTSDSAYIKPAGTETYVKEEGDPEGQFYTGVHVTLSATAEEAIVNGAGNFVWYSSSELLFKDYAGYGNSDLFTSTLNSMCNKKSSISIIGKSLDTPYLVMDKTESIVWMVIVIAVVPGAVLAGGFAVWYRRRRR